MVDVSKLVNELLNIYLSNGFKDAASINNGSCEDFAHELADIINANTDVKTQGYADVYWDCDICDMDGIHCFVSFNGLFYDSECPNGVEHPGDLPIYLRVENYEKDELLNAVNF